MTVPRQHDSRVSGQDVAGGMDGHHVRRGLRVRHVLREVVRVTYLQSPELRTLQVQMYTSVTTNTEPTIAAASSIIPTVTTLLILVPQVVKRQASRQRRQPYRANGPGRPRWHPVRRASRLTSVRTIFVRGDPADPLLYLHCVDGRVRDMPICGS